MKIFFFSLSLLLTFVHSVHLIPPSSSSTGGRRAARNGKHHPNAIGPSSGVSHLIGSPINSNQRGIGNIPPGVGGNLPTSINQTGVGGISSTGTGGGTGSYGPVHLAYEVKKLM